MSQSYSPSELVRSDVDHSQEASSSTATFMADDYQSQSGEAGPSSGFEPLPSRLPDSFNDKLQRMRVVLPEGEEGKAKVALKVLSEAGTSKPFKLPADAKLGKLFQAVEKLAASGDPKRQLGGELAYDPKAQGLAFKFEGEKVNPNTTPEDLDLEDDDLLEQLEEKALRDLDVRTFEPPKLEEFLFRTGPLPGDDGPGARGRPREDALRAPRGGLPRSPARRPARAACG